MMVRLLSRSTSLVAVIAWTSQAAGSSIQTDCQTTYSFDLGNGLCQEALNSADCGFDGGDCCECTCQDSDFFTCKGSAFNCLDPDVPCAKASVVLSALSAKADGDREPSIAPTDSPTDSPAHSLTDSLTQSPTAPLADVPPTASDTPNDADAGDAEASSTSDSSDSNSGVIIAVLLVVAVLVIAGVYFFRKRGSGRDATAGYLPPATAELA